MNMSNEEYEEYQKVERLKSKVREFVSTVQERKNGPTAPLTSSPMVSRDTEVKSHSEKVTIGYIMRNGNRAARRRALAQVKKRK
jgi:hypothetical protein